MNPPLRIYVAIWLALLVLLALSCGSSFLPLGWFNLVSNLAIALIKALLVVFFFMHLRRNAPIVWIAALSGVVWLLLLAGLSMADFAAR